jgi:rubrerythrin
VADRDEAPAPVAQARGHPLEERERIVEMLTKAYWMEIETVMSYLANSVNPDGVRAREIIKSLREDEEGDCRLFEGFLREHQDES